jgi:uncharacterized membrane protein
VSDLGSRRAFILTSIFAVAVFSLFFVGEDPGGLSSFLLLIVGPLVVLYFIVRYAVRAGAGTANKASATPQLRVAREILNARYASGEIGREDYREMRARLETS